MIGGSRWYWMGCGRRRSVAEMEGHGGLAHRQARLKIHYVTVMPMQCALVRFPRQVRPRPVPAYP